MVMGDLEFSEGRKGGYLKKCRIDFIDASTLFIDEEPPELDQAIGK